MDNNTEITVTIDWVSATHKYPTTIAPKNVITLEEASMYKGKPLNGYTDATYTEEGAIAQYSRNRPDMGIQFIYTGSTLARLMEKNINPLYVLNYHFRNGAEFSRVDIALDVFGTELTPQMIHQWLRDGIMRTTARTPPRLIDELQNGSTVYVGSRTSEKSFRAYDKRAERGMAMDEKSWIRLEMECKGEMANAVAHIACTGGADKLGENVRGIISSYVDSTHKLWKGIMSGAMGAKITIPRKTDRNTEHWLFTNVVSAIVNGMVEGRLPKDTMQQLQDAVERGLQGKTIRGIN